LRHLLKEADKSMARLDARRASLEEQLDAAGKAADHQELARVGAELTDVDREKAAAEDRWLELAEELEQAQAMASARRAANRS
jgi:hypothetical protein